MKNLTVYLFSLSTILINILAGHYFAPIEMLTTVIVLPIITLCVYHYLDTKLIYKMLFICLLIIANDVSIKFYGGGHHDQIGQFLVNSSSIIGALLAYICLSVSVIINTRKNIYIQQETIITLILFPLLLIVYSFFAWNIGLGRYI